MSEQRGALLDSPYITEATANELIIGAYGSLPTDFARERLFAVPTLRPEQLVIMEDIAVAGQEQMSLSHGRSWPVCHAGLVAWLGYNNGDHSELFSRDMARLDDEFGHTDLQKRIHALIPPWHDVDQTTVIEGRPRTGEDERSSAEQLIRCLRDTGLPAEVAEIAAYGILGTWPVIENGVPIDQWATLYDDYPSDAARLAAHMAATCDLTGIFSSRGPLNASYLYLQRQGLQPWRTPSIKQYEPYLGSTLGFLTNHVFPIPEANEIFTPLKPLILEYTEEKLDCIHEYNKQPRSLEEDAMFWQAVMGADMQLAYMHGNGSDRLASKW